MIRASGISFGFAISMKLLLQPVNVMANTKMCPQHGRIDAPWVRDHAMNGPAFVVRVKAQFLPTLTEGNIKIMDNLSSHRLKGICTAIERAGAELPCLLP